MSNAPPQDGAWLRVVRPRHGHLSGWRSLSLRLPKGDDLSQTSARSPANTAACLCTCACHVHLGRNISAWFRCLGACPAQSPGKPLLGPDVRPDHQALVPPPPGLRRLPPRRPRPVVALPRPRPLLPHARCAVPSRLRLLPGAFFQDHRRFNSTINGLDDSPIACSEARRSSATRAEINAQTDSRGDRYRSTDAPSRTGSQNKH